MIAKEVVVLRITAAICFSLYTVSLHGQPAIGLPTASPAVITQNTPATIRIGVKVNHTAANPVLADGVSLLRGTAILGVLNDKGLNGDLRAGDGIFSGIYPFNEASHGLVTLRVSVAFRGLLRRIMSESANIEVVPPGTPTSSARTDLTKAVLNPQTGTAILCDRLTVFFRPGTPFSTVSQAAAKVGGQIVGIVPYAQLTAWQFRIPCNGPQGVTNAVAVLDTDSATMGAEPVALVHASQTNDPRFGEQWGLARAEISRTWDVTPYGSGLPSAHPDARTIAIVDTGVDYNHPDLSGKVILGRDFVNGDDDPMDDNDHGTHVAGISAAVTGNAVGVSGTASAHWVLAVKVLDGFGDGSWGDVAAGIRDAVDRGAHVINLSLGGNGRGEELAQAIDYANRARRFVVAAAGNDNCSQRNYPAGFEDVETFTHRFGLVVNIYNTVILAVGATGLPGVGTTIQDPDAHAIWTPPQPQCTPESGSNWGAWVDMYAPGTNILSTIRNHNYAFFNGTSMATVDYTSILAYIYRK